MQIKIVSVGDVFQQGKLKKMKIKYEADGKEKERTLVGIGDTKAVLETLSSASAGEVYDVALKKDGEYWNWVGLEKLDRVSGSSKASERVASGRETSGSNSYESRFETPQERAARQVLIVRQSSVSNALEYLKATRQGGEFDISDIFGAARMMEDFVYGRMSKEDADGLMEAVSGDEREAE